MTDEYFNELKKRSQDLLDENKSKFVPAGAMACLIEISRLLDKTIIVSDETTGEFIKISVGDKVASVRGQSFTLTGKVKR